MASAWHRKPCGGSSSSRSCLACSWFTACRQRCFSFCSSSCCSSISTCLACASLSSSRRASSACTCAWLMESCCPRWPHPAWSLHTLPSRCSRDSRCALPLASWSRARACTLAWRRTRRAARAARAGKSRSGALASTVRKGGTVPTGLPSPLVSPTGGPGCWGLSTARTRDPLDGRGGGLSSGAGSSFGTSSRGALCLGTSSRSSSI
uniref:Uncharacterized protein n=1 Tax=Ixodes ricinus TaxID=34613 RepID=A0A6B0V487_IXORI